MLRHWWRWVLCVWYGEILRQRRENRWLVFMTLYIADIGGQWGVEERRLHIKKGLAFWKGETV